MPSSEKSFDFVEGSRRLKKLRNNRHISHATLSRETGINSESLKNFEKAGRYGGISFGKDRVLSYSGMRVDTLVKLADYFGVSADYLLAKTEENNYSNDETIRMISDYTGLSNEAVIRIHNLDDSNKHILSKLIESDITGVLDSIDSAFMTIPYSQKENSKTLSTNLQFDDLNTPYIKLSPKDTISFFTNKACDIAANIIKLVINEKLSLNKK